MVAPCGHSAWQERLGIWADIRETGREVIKAMCACVGKVGDGKGEGATMGWASETQVEEGAVRA